jgi:cytochrome c
MVMKKILVLTLVLAALIAPTGAKAEELVGDAAKGKKYAKKCAACHTFDSGGKNKSGPNLFGIVGKGIAETEGYKYSKAFKARKGQDVWDVATLSAYLKKPKKWEPKTKMAFIGIKKDQKRANLIAYLETLK